MNDKRFQKKLEKIRKKGERQKEKAELEAQYAEYYPHRRGAKVSNLMLVIIVLAITVYTIASFVLQFCTAVEISSTLTTCFFAFWSAEIIALAGIRVSKVRKNKDEEDLPDDESEG
jgi:hypothetical protein